MRPFAYKKPAEIRSLVRANGNKVYLQNGYRYESVYSSKSVEFGLPVLHWDGERVCGYIDDSTGDHTYYCREEFLDNYLCYHDVEPDTVTGDKPATILLMIRVNYKALVSGVRLLNNLERRARWGLTWVCRTSDTDHSDECIVVGSRFWSSSVPMLSMYMMMLRSLSSVPVNPHERLGAYLVRVSTSKSNDSPWFKRLLEAHPDFLRIVTKHRYALFNNWWKYQDSIDSHYDGINRLFEAAILTNKICEETTGDTRESILNILFCAFAPGSPQKNKCMDIAYTWYNSRNRYDELHRITTLAPSHETIDGARALAKLLKKYKGRRVT